MRGHVGLFLCKWKLIFSILTYLTANIISESFPYNVQWITRITKPDSALWNDASLSQKVYKEAAEG